VKAKDYFYYVLSNKPEDVKQVLTSLNRLMG